MKYHLTLDGTDAACGSVKNRPDTFLYTKEQFAAHYSKEDACKKCASILPEQSHTPQEQDKPIFTPEKEIRVYGINANEYDGDIRGLENAAFLDIAEDQNYVWTLTGYAEAFNNEEVPHDLFIRFMSPSDYPLPEQPPVQGDSLTDRLLDNPMQDEEDHENLVNAAYGVQGDIVQGQGWELDFIESALNSYWNDANQSLQRKDLGDIERINYEGQLTKSKEIMQQIDSGDFYLSRENKELKEKFNDEETMRISGEVALDMIEKERNELRLKTQQQAKEMAKLKETMHENMQFYMEHCQREGYVSPMDWIEKHKHF